MTFIREAGPPVWFVLALGAFALFQAVRYRLEAARASDVIGAVSALLLAGAVGTAWGAQLAFAGMRELPDPAQQGWIAWIGIKEALYNFDVAGVGGILACLVATVGRRRSAVASAG
jgi:hypothetical protein